MKFSRYLQDVPQTDDEKVEMYKKCSIEELAKMHVELEKHFNRLMLEVKTKEERLTNIIENYFKLYDAYKRDTGNYPDIELTLEGEIK